MEDKDLTPLAVISVPMSIKEKLLQEIESSSDSLLEETLDFLRFLKTKQATVNKDAESPNFTQKQQLPIS